MFFEKFLDNRSFSKIISCTSFHLLTKASIEAANSRSSGFDLTNGSLKKLMIAHVISK